MIFLNITLCGVGFALGYLLATEITHEFYQDELVELDKRRADDIKRAQKRK